MDLNSVISIAFKTIGVNRTLADMKKVVMETQLVNAGGRGTTLRGELNKIASSKGGLEQLNTQIKKLSLEPFRMELLSTMFFSMMVWRQMTALFRSMIETIKVLGGKFHPINLALTKMAVAWEIIKYTLINALTPVFIQVADWLMWLAEAMQDMDPETIEKLADALLIIAAIAGFGFLASQMGLFVSAVKNLIKIAGGTAIADLTSLSGVLSTLAGLGAIALTVSGIFDLFDPEKSILLGIGKAMAGVSWWIPGPLGLAIGGIGLALQIWDIYGGSGGQDWARWLTETLVIGKAFAYSPALGMFALSAVIVFEGLNATKVFGEIRNFFAKVKEATGGLFGIETTTSFDEIITKYAEVKTQMSGMTDCQSRGIINAEEFRALLGATTQQQSFLTTEVGSTATAVQTLLSPAVLNLQKDIDLAGASAGSMNSTLSSDVHKYVYIHVVKTKAGSETTGSSSASQSAVSKSRMNSNVGKTVTI